MWKHCLYHADSPIEGHLHIDIPFIKLLIFHFENKCTLKPCLCQHRHGSWQERGAFNPQTTGNYFRSVILFSNIVPDKCIISMWNWFITMNIKAALRILMSRYFSTKASVARRLGTHPCFHSCLWIKRFYATAGLYLRGGCKWYWIYINKIIKPYLIEAGWRIYASVHWPSLVQMTVVAWSAPNHYLNQCWIIINWIPRNKIQWNINRNSCIFIHENPFQNVVRKTVATLSRPQCVKTCVN